MYKFIGNHYPNITYTDQKFLVMFHATCLLITWQQVLLSIQTSESQHQGSWVQSAMVAKLQGLPASNNCPGVSRSTVNR